VVVTAALLSFFCWLAGRCCVGCFNAPLWWLAAAIVVVVAVSFFQLLLELAGRSNGSEE